MGKKQVTSTVAFKQQELPAYQPVLTPVTVIVMLLVVFIVFLPIGIVLEDGSNQVISNTVRYDNLDDCKVTDKMDYTQLPVTCNVTVHIDQKMEAPIYFYYELENFYQNHRKYVASKSDTQLQGDGDSEVDDDCSPLKKNGGKTLLACGLIANSFFEDRFSADVYRDGALVKELCPTCINYGMNSTEWLENWSTWYKNRTWQKEGIAWDSDLDQKYRRTSPDNDQTRIGIRQETSGLRLPDTNDEDFVVWMRTAALPNFRKLHRINKDVDFESGDRIHVTILNWFPVEKFNGKKFITFATTKWCGSANHVLAWLYIVVACVAIGLTVTFAILLLFGKRSVKSYIAVRDGASRWS